MNKNKPQIVISNDCLVFFVGRQPPEVFNTYKQCLKNIFKAKYNIDHYAWRIKPQQVNAVKHQLELLGFDVTVQNSDSPFVEAKIQVKVRFAEGKIKFKCSENNNTFNEIFSNKSGILTGITEYLPDTYERATTSFSLAQEAIEILQQENFSVVLDDSYITARAIWQAQEESFKNMDPKISEVLAPGLSLFQHQNKAIARIEQSNGKLLLGACMGAGKTVISLAFAAKHRFKVCVICPKTVRRNWITEAKKFFPSVFNVCFELGKYDKNLNLEKADLVVVNYEGLGKWSEKIIKGQFDLLVIDESHLCANKGSLRTQRVLNVSQYFKYKLLLSGTAVKNNREDLYAQLEILDNKEFFDDCGLFTAPTGQFWHAIQSVYLAMPKSEILPFLPKKTIIRYDQFVKNPVDLPASIEEIMVFKHNCAKSKIDATCEKISDILENSDDCILVFSEFVDICKEIYERFKKVSLYHDGQMTHEKREQIKNSFQREGNHRVFISTRQSLAVGVNLTRASHVVFNDLPWCPADIDQASDRCHRIGQNKPVFVYWVIAENSEFDLRLIKLISKKYELQKAVTEGKQLTKEEQEFLSTPISYKHMIKGATFPSL